MTGFEDFEAFVALGVEAFEASASATGALRGDDSTFVAFWADLVLYSLFSFVDEFKGAVSGDYSFVVDFLFSVAACFPRFAASLAFFLASLHGEASIPLVFNYKIYMHG